MKKYIIYVLIIKSSVSMGMNVSDELEIEQKIRKKVFRAVNASLKQSDSMSITSSGEFSIEEQPSKNIAGKVRLRDPLMTSKQSTSLPKRASSIEQLVKEQKEKELKELEERGIRQKTFLALLSK